MTGRDDPMVFWSKSDSSNKQNDKTVKVPVTDASDDSSAADVTGCDVNDAEDKQQGGDIPLANEGVKVGSDDNQAATPVQAEVPRQAPGMNQPRSQTNGSSPQTVTIRRSDYERLVNAYNRLVAELKTAEGLKAQFSELQESNESIRLQNELLRKQNLELKESLKKAESARQAAEDELATGVGKYHDEANRRLEDRQRVLLAQLASEEDLQRKQVAGSVERIRELDESARQSVRASVTEAERKAKEIMAEAINDLDRTYGQLREDLADWQGNLFTHKLDGLAIFIQNYYLALDKLKLRMLGDAGYAGLGETYNQFETCRVTLELACSDLGVGLVWVAPGEKYNHYKFDLCNDNVANSQADDAQLVVSRCVAPGVKQILSGGREKVIRNPMVEVKAV